MAAGLFRKTLALIASLPPKEQSKVPIIRLDQTCRDKLGGIYLSLGRQKEADALLEPMRGPTLCAIVADPIDTRARDDLIALDTTILNATPLEDTSTTRALMREYLDTTEYLIRSHPASHEWQFVHAEALLNYGKLYTDLGDRQSAAREFAAQPRLRRQLSNRTSLRVSRTYSDHLCKLLRNRPVSLRQR